MSTIRSLHFDAQVLSRGGGKSSVRAASYRSGVKLKQGREIRSTVASASYRSGQRLYDEKTQQTFDYTRKEDIKHSEILAPKNAPDWVFDREKLWNAVEASETRKNSQLAKDIIAVFPRELELEECKTMLREYVNDNFVSKGMIADFSIHETVASDGGKNPHAHIMLTTRDIKKQNPDSPALKKYFMHGIGHSLGLAVHDVTAPHATMQAGWVMTVEPAIYIPEEGFGIRLENNVLIAETGPVDLMADIPIEAGEIEQLMRRQ